MRMSSHPRPSPSLPTFIVCSSGPRPNSFPLPPPYGPRLHQYATLLTTPIDLPSRFSIYLYLNLTATPVLR
ncbi:hypothetical protein MVEN_01631700 [Mycena venus]|uniref:Uncharacterized protein n=1 Tax=Mycena venus TaxID=2733690 RepID=A0A8H7CNW5_9AGAR|nr:hypothetical protein MVEN_01631700 [Mycena venus]